MLRPGMFLESCPSTQDVLRQEWEAGNPVAYVSTRIQTKGRGRRSREWITVPGASLAVSFAFPDWADHPRPWLLGMLVGLVVAEITEISVRWPNDLVADGMKLGGILHERPLVNGKPLSLVGVGLNLVTEAVPEELRGYASSLEDMGREVPEPEAFVVGLNGALRAEPRPSTFAEIAPRWNRRDVTLGKSYRDANGVMHVGEGIDEEGRLVTRDGRIEAAEAIFGPL